MAAPSESAVRRTLAKERACVARAARAVAKAEAKARAAGKAKGKAKAKAKTKAKGSTAKGKAKAKEDGPAAPPADRAEPIQLQELLQSVIPLDLRSPCASGSPRLQEFLVRGFRSP